MRNVSLKLFAILALALGLVACGINTSSQENWRPTNVSAANKIESIPCNEIDSAKHQIESAVKAARADEGSPDLLKTLGLWKDGMLDLNMYEGDSDAPEGTPLNTGVQQRLEDRAVECADTPDTSSSEPQPTVAASPEDCVEGGTPLKYDPNKDMNVVSGGIKDRDDDLQAMKTDPKNLAYRAHHLGFWDNPKDWDALTENDGKCLSREGEKIYSKVEGALTASTTKVDENGVADANWYNTGMQADGPVVNPASGIEGNLDAIVYTLEDGTKVVVLKRCANLALPAAPKEYTPKYIPGSTKPPSKQPPGTPPAATPPPEVPPTQPPGTPPPNTPPPYTPPPTQPPVAPKQPTLDPYPRGNAPIGGGQNADPGPGVQQQWTPPPVAPYTPPPAPAPQPVPSDQGGPAPIETPRYIPPAEEAAPAPEAPETACIPAPGMTSC